MDQETLAAIRHLLTSRKVLCLAVSFDGEPATSLLPFATAVDLTAAYVQASSLARHTRILQRGGKVSILVHGLDTDEADALQIERLSIQCVPEQLADGSNEQQRARDRFLARFPTAKLTLDLPDFALFALRFGRARYVAGFAQAFNVSAEDWKQMARAGE